MTLSAHAFRRYQRHLTLPEVGTEGQEKLAAARVLIIGLGGLGCPVASYLTAAGVGTLGLVDDDLVELSNLQRQVLYTEADIGESKVAVAAARLRLMNPELTVHEIARRLTVDNAREMLSDYDLIVDGTDNFPTRYAVNDACVTAGKPNVYGSIYRFEGQVSVLATRAGPCYRCLFPQPPPAALVPNCAEAGVLGVLPGLIGCTQALEAIKLILGQGESLIGRLLLFDALAMTWQALKVVRDPNCPACGTGVLTPPDAPPAAAEGSAEIAEIAPSAARELLARPDVLLLDVREPHEYEFAHIAGARLLPLGQLQQRLSEIADHRGPIIAYCHHGMRSLRGLRMLQAAGFRQLNNLAGGIDAWSLTVDDAVPRY